MSVLSFSAEQIRRYSRHILLPDVGGAGQKRLLQATVAVDVGADSAAEIAALAYLAAAGVGCLLLGGAAAGAVTAREVACGILYGIEDEGRPRVEAISERLGHINPDVQVALGTDAARAGAVPLAPSPDDAPPDAPDDPGVWFGDATSDDEAVAVALVRGGVRAVRTLTRLLSPQPA